MNWIRDTAAEIAETISGRTYLQGEYGTSFRPDPQNGEWIADSCPLCSSAKTFAITETPGHLGDWRCSKCPSRPASSGPLKGIHPHHGDLVTLVALKRECSQAEAVRKILDQAKPYRVASVDPGEEKKKALRLACKYFRWMLEHQPRVVQYLDDRGIKWRNLQADFEIGGNDISIDGLAGFLSHAPQLMGRLRQGRDTLIYRRSISCQPAVVAPLIETDGSFAGLQLRRCDEETAPHYINKGLSKSAKARFVYGLHLERTREAVAAADKVIVGKGVFDCWACHQDGHQNTVAALGEGMTELQFARVAALGASEMVLGFTNEKELKIATALARGTLKITALQFSAGRDLADSALSNGAIAKMIARRVELMETDKRAQGAASVRESHRKFQTELDAGRYFHVGIEDIKISNSRELKRLLEESRSSKKRPAKKQPASKYVKVPYCFVDDRLYVEAGAALRLLMYLHTKKTGRNLPVSIKIDTIATELRLDASSIKKQKAKLRKMGLLVDVPPSAKGPRKAWELYPLFVPVAREEDK